MLNPLNPSSFAPSAPSFRSWNPASPGKVNPPTETDPFEPGKQGRKIGKGAVGSSGKNVGTSWKKWEKIGYYGNMWENIWEIYGVYVCIYILYIICILITWQNPFFKSWNFWKCHVRRLFGRLSLLVSTSNLSEIRQRMVSHLFSSHENAIKYSSCARPYSFFSTQTCPKDAWRSLKRSSNATEWLLASLPEGLSLSCSSEYMAASKCRSAASKSPLFRCTWATFRGILPCVSSIRRMIITTYIGSTTLDLEWFR